MSGPTSGRGEAAICANCGAPDDGELVHCKFCQSPCNAEAARTAVPCPNCRTACRWGKQKCVKCQAWLVVSCVFCGSLSPHNISNCLQCNEAFAGAPQRKAALEQQRQQQSAIDIMGAAAPLLGVALGAAVSTSWSDSSSSSDSVDTFSNDAFSEIVGDAGADDDDS